MSFKVDPVTDEELETYKTIDFNIEDFRGDLAAAKLTEDNKADLLMRRWRFPTLSVHGWQVKLYCRFSETHILGRFC